MNSSEELVDGLRAMLGRGGGEVNLIETHISWVGSEAGVDVLHREMETIEPLEGEELAIVAVVDSTRPLDLEVLVKAIRGEGA